MQANVFATGANFKLVLALNTKVTFRADTVFPETMSLIESFEFIAKLLKEFCIFRTRSAASAILTLQTALGRGLAVAKFTNRAMEACWAIASLMTEAKDKNV
jgi:hypothetical protein